MKSLKKFLFLSQTSDLLIKRYQNYKFIKIIPTLHVLREHPEDLKKYNLLLDRQISKMIYLFFYSFYYYFLDGIRNIFKQGEISYGVNQLKYNSYSNIFISHFINSSQFSTYNDFYFTNMPNISSNKVRTLVILINHSKLDLSKLLHKFDLKDYEVIILSNKLDLKNNILLIISTLKACCIIFKDIIFNLKSSHKFFMLNALAHIFTKNSQFTFRLFYQIKKIVRMYQPKNFFFTYEGHAWEKALCMAVKNVSTTTKCIGFQHSRLFKYQHSMKREFLNEMDPDIVLTSGKYSYIELQKKIKKIKIINIGKFESKKEFIKKMDNFDLKKSVTICVLPEAQVDECYKLFNFSLKCNLLNKNLFFIWRFHPLTDQDEVLLKLKINNNLPKNIIISNTSLENDLMNSHMVLYRGSAAALNAMRMGIFPVYYTIENEFDIDFIDEEYNWNIKTSSPDEMFKKIEHLTQSKEKILELQKEVINYNNNYFSIFDQKKFYNLFCKH